MEDKLTGFTEVNAPTLLSNTIRDQKLSPTVGERQYIPQDEEVEGKLVEIEKLMRRGSYNAALRSAQSINFEEVNLASTYALIVNEKVARANVALGDRYLAKGDLDRAKNNYQAAVELANSDEKTKAVTGLAQRAIKDLSESRSSLVVDNLREILISQDYERWCEIRKGIKNTSILDHLSSVGRDVSLTEKLEPQVPPRWPPKADPSRGWTDPLPIDELTTDNKLESVLLDRPSIIPGSSFSTTSARQLSLESISNLTSSVTQGNELRASSSFPLMAAVLTAQGRLYAIENKLNFIGVSAGSTPLYRYSYLVEQTKKKLDFVAELDTKMLPMQIKLDDFEAVVGPLQKYINELSAELQALNTKIAELLTTLTSLNVADGKIGQTVQALTEAEDDCDVEWWEVLLSIVVVIVATAVGAGIGAGIGFLIGSSIVGGAVAGGVAALATSIGLTIQVWSDREITCDNVSQARQDFQSAQSALKASINDVQAELNQALINRDIVITELASLIAEFNEANKSDQARVLNKGTLSRILGILDTVRRNMIMRTHTLARMAQDAFNAENDEQVNVIASSYTYYLDEDSKGYTASSVLKRDLDGLEHIRLTGRTRKKMQLSQTVSLRKHYPSSFASILTTGFGQFATRLSDFDRWFPGTYMQTLKEVQVEVFIEGKPQPIRGYLTNNGVSYVRFADYGNYVEIDNNDVVAEPDQDLRRLCYKRRRRHHTVETMAFPSFESTLYDARATEIQEQERNFFESCGLESTWQIELMPDQILEYARITDIKVNFQFEALFDTALKRVVESKRYLDRNETAIVSIRQLLREQDLPVDFTQPIEANVNSFMFEAPYLEKDILDVALMIRPKQLPLLDGVAKLRLGYQQQSPIEVETNEQGIVATADTKPTGSNISSLVNLTQGKNVAGKWLIEILDLPQDFQVEDIDDLLLMLRYTFKPT